MGQPFFRCVGIEIAVGVLRVPWWGLCVADSDRKDRNGGASYTRLRLIVIERIVMMVLGLSIGNSNREGRHGCPKPET